MKSSKLKPNAIYTDSMKNQTFIWPKVVKMGINGLECSVYIIQAPGDFILRDQPGVALAGFKAF